MLCCADKENVINNYNFYWFCISNGLVHSPYYVFNLDIFQNSQKCFCSIVFFSLYPLLTLEQKYTVPFKSVTFSIKCSFTTIFIYIIYKKHVSKKVLFIGFLTLGCFGTKTNRFLCVVLHIIYKYDHMTFQTKLVHLPPKKLKMEGSDHCQKIFCQKCYHLKGKYAQIYSNQMLCNFKIHLNLALISSTCLYAIQFWSLNMY